jgi:hypothetical protein
MIFCSLFSNIEIDNSTIKLYCTGSRVSFINFEREIGNCTGELQISRRKYKFLPAKLVTHPITPYCSSDNNVVKIFSIRS